MELKVNSDQHSPILGYAYDGNPIYGHLDTQEEMVVICSSN